MNATTGKHLLVAAALIGTCSYSGLTAAAQTSPKISFDEAERIALDHVPGGVVEDIEREYRLSGTVYEVEVRAPDGLEYDLTIDATDGTILHEDIDD